MSRLPQNVRTICQHGTPTELLTSALNSQLTEVIIVGKLPDGTYRVSMSPHQNVVEQIGVLRLAEDFAIESTKW